MEDEERLKMEEERLKKRMDDLYNSDDGKNNTDGDDNLYYFLRFTTDAEADLERGTVFRPTATWDRKSFRSIEGDREYKIMGGRYYVVEPGLCGYGYGRNIRTACELEVELTRTNRWAEQCAEGVFPVIFQGHWLEERWPEDNNRDRGDLFAPIAIVKTLRRLKTVREKLRKAFWPDDRLIYFRDGSYDKEIWMWDNDPNFAEKDFTQSHCVGEIAADEGDTDEDIFNSVAPIRRVH